MSVSTDPTVEVTQPTTRSESSSRSTADLLFDTFFGAGVGGSAIALFFLVVDGVLGRLLFTPSAMGTALFTGEVVSSATPVQLDMVAFYSIAHFAVFAAIALAGAMLTRWRPELLRRPAVLAAIIFAVLTAGLLAADALLMNGVVSAIGLVPVLAANAITGVAMTVFYRVSERQRS